MNGLVTLTCSCGARNERNMPYDKVMPDYCYSCGKLLHAPPRAAVRRGDWIQTYSGRQFWPLDPRADEVDIDDIAHHLAMLCRFTGACRRFYSVAEHSVKVSYVATTQLTDKRLVLRALLHDAAEAYCNDIARPVKRNILGYDDIEQANQTAIFDRFGLPAADDEADAIIKQADNAMLLAEQRFIMTPCEHSWRPENVPPAMQALAFDLMDDREWNWRKAERMFLERFDELVTG